jgi:hypothetical protein
MNHAADVDAKVLDEPRLDLADLIGEPLRSPRRQDLHRRQNIGPFQSLRAASENGGDEFRDCPARRWQRFRGDSG